MKKAKYFGAIFTLFSMVFSMSLVGPAFASTNNTPTATSSVSTSLSPSDGGGAAPIIKAKWEMNAPYDSLKGTDDDDAPGAQFDAPGVWGEKMDYSVCAVVSDPDGENDIDGVYTDIYYPEDVAFHPDSNNPDQTGGGTAEKPDYGEEGCGEIVHDENKLNKLSKTDGYDLFCDTIKNNNNNLPKFYDSYDYNEICDADGDIMKETAHVYCTDKQLIWEDPAGDYKASVFALDDAGVFSNTLSNTFEYLPLTAFEADFDSVDYGKVKLKTTKTISGDKTWSTSDKPTVRNTGNTRLYMGVMQDDMGFGTTDGAPNIKYAARVGNNEDDWTVNYPDKHKWVEDILDLSEIEEMDFKVFIKKFPENTNYSGEMVLDAKYANFRQCSGQDDEDC